MSLPLKLRPLKIFLGYILRLTHIYIGTQIILSLMTAAEIKWESPKTFQTDVNFVPKDIYVTLRSAGKS
jgi:hypothetical protein